MSQKKEIDIDQIEVLARMLAENSNILNYLEHNSIASFEVTVNEEFDFTISGNMLETAIKGFKYQLKSRVQDLKAQLVLL